MPDTGSQPTSWAGARLHVVTGKGGTGKTTMAASLALALAHGGHRVLLMEVEGRQGLAQIFDTPPLPYAERKVAVAPSGGEVWALAVDPEEALLEYLEMFYNLRRAGSVLRKLGAIDFATTIAPGIRDVLLTGKAIEVTKRREKNQPNPYDYVVLDAPPTGRITRFLNVNTEVAGIAKVGPIRNHADSVMAVLRSPRTAVHLVTILEEMPVQETIDGIAELRAAELPVGGVFINAMRPPFLNDGSVDEVRERILKAKRLDEILENSGLKDKQRKGLGKALLTEARDHVDRIDLERRERQRLIDVGLPFAELPWLSSGIDLGALYELAAMMREQGVTP